MNLKNIFSCHRFLSEKLSCCILMFSTVSLAQGDCNNVGFEDGTTSNWICGSGTYGLAKPNRCSETFPLIINSNDCLDGKKDNPLKPANVATCRHTIMTTASGTDPNSLNTVSCVAPGNLFPSGTNQYSFRIGNSTGSVDPVNGTALAFAESIKYKMKVSQANAGLTYMYAAFLNANGHAENIAPRFEIKITHMVNGKEEAITCGYYKVVADAANKDFKKGASDGGDGTWLYTDWKKVAVDLTNYIGEEVTIEFTTADCYPSKSTTISSSNGKTDTVCSGWGAGGHGAYAYIDLYCAKVEIPSPVICANKPSVEICGPPGYLSYSWPSNQPGLQAPYNKQCVTIKDPKAGDVYIVNMVSSAVGNCVATAKLTLQGNNFELKDTAVCIGSQPFKLHAITNNVGKFSWKWEPQQNLDRYDVADPTFTATTAAGTTTYTVTMIDEVLANCNQVKMVKVTVGASFTVKTSDVEICEGETATLTATGADEYTWEPGPLTGATVTVTPTTTTKYTVTGKSNTATCSGDDKAEATVTVRLKPVVEVADQTICIGDTAKLNGSVTMGGATGTWIGGTGRYIPSRAAADAWYVPSSAEITAGSVQLTLESEDPLGPCVKDSKSMTLTIVPLVTADAGKDDTICEGSTAILNAKFGGAATGGKWSGGTGTFSPNEDSPEAVYTPSDAEIAAGKVILTFSATNATNASCPGGSDTKIILIDKQPVVEAGPLQNICFETFATLAGKLDGGATSATWSGGGGIYQPDNTSLTPKYIPSASEMLAGTVKLILTTNASGKCPAAADTTIIIIDPLAVVDAGPHQIVCIGNPVKLNPTISGSAITGSWSGGTGVFTPDNNTPAATYTPGKADETAGKVILTFTSNDPPGPCTAVSDTMSISIIQLPKAIAGDGGDICAGKSISLKGAILNASQGTWSGGNGTYDKNNKQLNAIYSPSADEITAEKVTLTLTTDSIAYCPVHKSTVTYFINPVPVINFSVDIPSACPPHCVNFFDSTTAGSSTIVKWEWNFSQPPLSAVKDPKGICFPTPGTYDVTLTATTNKACSANLKKDKYILTYPAPDAEFTADPFKVSLYDPSIQFYDQSTTTIKTWIWNLGDGTIISPNKQHPFHKYDVGVSGIYDVHLKVINEFGCVDTVMHPVEVLPEFAFYIPNAFTPTQSEGVNDTFYGKGVGIIDYHIWIFDRWGNMVFDTTDINVGWDGKANGGQDIAQKDVYVWKVKLKDIFGKKHEYIGTVTLVK